MAQSVTAGGYNCVFSTNCYEATGYNTERPLVVEIDKSNGNQPSLVLPGMTLKAIKQIDEHPRLVCGTVSYVSNLERNTVPLLTVFEDGSASGLLSGTASEFASRAHSLKLKIERLGNIYEIHRQRTMYIDPVASADQARETPKP